MHLVSKDTKQWVADFDSLSGFDQLDFIEIWAEETDISDKELQLLKSFLSGYEVIVHAPFINLSLVSSHNSINTASLATIKKSINLEQRS